MYLENLLDREVIRVDMPCRENARYDEWKINFENYLPLLPEKMVLVVYSLGGTFLAKYLSENDLEMELFVFLVSPAYDNDLPDEELVGGFQLDDLSGDLSMLEENCEQLTLFFSEDDDIVPIRHADKFGRELEEAEIVRFSSKNSHFDVEEFPELLERIGKVTE